MLPPEFPLLSGNEAITGYLMGAAETHGFKISWEPISAHIAASGDPGPSASALDDVALALDRLINPVP